MNCKTTGEKKRKQKQPNNKKQKPDNNNNLSGLLSSSVWIVDEANRVKINYCMNYWS